jgi:hypothetical protein
MRVDSKGKYYTKIVSTHPLDVVLRLASGEMIWGTVHIRPEHRLSDELNAEGGFMPVTGASVFLNDVELYQSAFISVSRQAIQWMIPVQAIGEADDSADDETELDSLSSYIR